MSAQRLQTLSGWLGLGKRWSLGGGLALLCASACTVVDTSGLPPIDDYTSWPSVEAIGPVPGHGDTYRIIFANEIATGYGHAGPYAPGSVLVKEIRELDGGGPGALLYLAVMRKLDEAPPDGTLQGGWQFTRLSGPGEDEVYRAGCWENCHVQAPVDGAWYDYGLLIGRE